MAINKNFVIKNGIQVNDTLLVGDSTNNKVGINTTTPDYELHVIGGIGVTDAKITGVTTALGDVLVANSNGEDGKAFAVRVSAGNSVGINSANPRYPLEVIGPVSIGQTAQYIFGDLGVSGDINSANFISGSAQFSGITTFTNTANNILGNAETGAVQIRGGLGVAENVTIGSGLTVGAGLSVHGDSYFVGVVTFAGGAAGTIQLGDGADDNVEFQADVNSNIIPNAAGFDLGSSGQQWGDLYLSGIATVGRLSVAGFSTFRDNVQITSLTDNRIAIVGAGSTIEDSADLTFDGNSLAVGTALTVTGISTFNNNVSIASLTNNRIPIVGAGSTIEDDANLTFDESTLAIGVDLDVTGNAGIGSLVISGISTFSDNVEITSLTENRIPIIGAGSTIEDSANLTFDDSTLAVGVDLDVDGHTELDDLNVAGVSTFNDNVRIASLTDNRIAIVGAGNTIEDDANLTFDATTLSVGAALTVTGITTFTDTTENTLGDTGTGAVKIAGGLGVAGNVTVGSGLSVFGNSYFVGMVTFAAGTDGNITIGDANTDNVVFNADVDSSFIPNTDNTYDLGSSSQQWKDLYVNGLAELDFVNVSAAATFGSDIDANGNLDVDGQTELDDLNVSGISTFVGLSTFNDGLIVHTGITTLATLNIGNAIGITSIVDEDNMASDSATALPTQQSVKAYVDAQVTAQDLDFQADTGGTLSIDLDSETLSVLGTTNEIETAGSGNQIQIGLPNNVIVGSALTVTDVFAVGTAITASSGIITATSLDISGNAGIGSLSVAGVSTFVGLSTFNDGIIVQSGISTFDGRIVGAAVSNVIPFYYNNVSDFPSAVTYHGAFGHAHNTGKAYFAHGGVWLELVNTNTASVVGTGTEGYNVGVVTATQADIGNGGLDVDGHTELDGVNVSGVTTTQTLHVGTGGTTLTVSADNATFAIGSATTTITATMNGGAIPSIGLVIALGG